MKYSFDHLKKLSLIEKNVHEKVGIYSGAKKVLCKEWNVSAMITKCCQILLRCLETEKST